MKQPIALDGSRWSAVGILAAFLALLYGMLVMPLAGLTGEYRDRVEELRFRLERFQKIGAEKPSLIASRDSLKSAGHGGDFLPTEAASLSSADLQTRIKQAVGDAGGELSSTQVIPEHREDQFTRIAVKVRMNGSSPILKKVLYSFESARPFLFVENLNIRPIRTPRNPNAKEQLQPDKLSIDFDVVGYMQAP